VGPPSAPLIIRHLGVGEFGRYVTVVSLMNLVAGVTEGGLNAIALREYATLRGDARRAAMRSLMGIRLALSLVGVAVGILFALVAGYDSPLVFGAVGAGIAVVLQAVQMLVATPLQGELRFGWISMLQLLGQILTVALVVVLVLADAGVVAAYLGGAPA
jgi:O-antigen/teichoic acid export membrane protein